VFTVLVEHNFSADPTPVGSAQSFSLTINPDATIQDVSVTGITLSGPGVNGVPEPGLGILVAIGLGGLAVYRSHCRRRNRRHMSAASDEIPIR